MVVLALLLFRQIISLFLIMACGFLAVRLRLLKGADSKVLSILSIYLIVPCVIIKSFQIELTDQVRDGFLLATAVAVAAHGVLLVVSWALRRACGLDAVERASVVYSNAGNLIIPLVTALLGEEWVIYSSAFICVQQIFVWTHAQAILSGQKGINWKKLLLNMNVISIALGLALMLLRVRLPEVLLSSVSAVSATIGPVSMIMLGMLLAEVNFRAIVADRRVYLISALRLVAVPLLMLCLMKLSGLAGAVPEGRTILYISFMAMMTPAATMVTQLSQLNDNRPGFASSVNVMTTLLCVVTMPLLTQLYMTWM